MSVNIGRSVSVDWNCMSVGMALQQVQSGLPFAVIRTADAQLTEATLVIKRDNLRHLRSIGS